MASPQDSLFDSVDYLNRQFRALNTPVLETEDLNRINSIVLNAFLDAGARVLQGLTAATEEARARVSAKLDHPVDHPAKKETSHRVTVK